MTKPNLTEPEIENEGRKAARNDVPATNCPFSFINTEWWATKDYEGFAREGRWRLNAWMRGWIAETAALKAKHK